MRDLDVFLNTKVKRLAAAEPPIAGLADLVGELDYRRAVAAEAAKAAIASSRYRLLIFNALEWIEDGAWLKRRSVHNGRRAKPFAADLFARRIAKAKKRAKDIRHLNVHDRHKLRIAMKKLRYSIYFFESLFDGQRVGEGAVPLQDRPCQPAGQSRRAERHRRAPEDGDEDQNRRQ